MVASGAGSLLMSPEPVAAPALPAAPWTAWFTRRDRLAVLVAAAALILLRSIIYAWFEQSYFDSDQAIVGLMAKHLSEGRAFPLYFYGQTYLLGVEAWLAVPFFWAAGPTVAALRASLIVTNVAAAALIITGLVRFCGLKPWQAFAASIVFLLAPPRTAAFLVEAQGGNIEPFVYVALLWFLRTRPLWFGVVLAVGVLNREFTLYAVAVLLAGQALTGTLFSRAAVRRWLLSLVSFAAAWEAVHALEPWADMMGPGTRGTLLRGFSNPQVGNLLDRFNWAPGQFPARVGAFALDFFPSLLGVRPISDVVAAQGHGWLVWPLALAALVATGRLAWVASRDRPGATGPDHSGASRWGRETLMALAARASFAWYLLGVGALASLVYVVARPVDFATARYALLALLIPVGVAGAFLAIEPGRPWRIGLVLALAAWTVSSAWDNGRLIARYVMHPPPDHVRQLADILLTRGVTVAEAPYWRAYRLAFITRERIEVASSDVVRIEAYQRRAAQQGSSLVVISQDPCPGGEQAGIWYLCRPAR